MNTAAIPLLRSRTIDEIRAIIKDIETALEERDSDEATFQAGRLIEASRRLRDAI